MPSSAACEAALEKQREFHDELGTKLSGVQGRYYELGAEVTRTEENIRYTTELRTRHREDLAQTSLTLAEVGSANRQRPAARGAAAGGNCSPDP